jgi:hypothetical protein
MPQQLNIGVWKRDLAEVYRSNTVGAGSVALLQLINLQLGQASTMIGALSDDAFVQRGIKDWRIAYNASNWRLGWMIRKLQSIAEDKLHATRALSIWNYVGRPVLEGLYPADMMAEIDAAGMAYGIRPVNGRDWSDGGKSFGEAFAAATLWNQAATVSDFDATLGTGWATNVVRSWLTETARQLEQSAPGEAPTIADATVVVLRRLADAPGDILRAVGISPVMVAVTIGGVLVVLYLLSR